MIEKAGLPITQLLWVDKQMSSPNSLPDCLGDGYLYKLNPLFRGVRDAALAAGAHFREAPNSLGRLYGIAPLFALDRILEDAEIPYRGDVQLLEEVLARSPGQRIDLHDLRGLVAGHRLLHESAHLVAERFLSVRWAPSAEYAPLAGIVRSLLGEAFANSIEAVGNALADNRTHRALWAWNSYIVFDDSQYALLRACKDVLGPAVLFELAFWVFFHFNVRAETNILGDKYVAECSRCVLSGAGLSEGERRLAESIGPVLFGLSRTFRDNTTNVYFRVRGQEDALRKVRELDLDSPLVLQSLGLPHAARLFGSFVNHWTLGKPVLVARESACS